MVKIPKIPGLEVKAMETKTIFRGQGAYYATSLFKFANGELSIPLGIDSKNAGRTWRRVPGGLHSKDYGRTWRKKSAPFIFSTDAFQFPNGEVIQFRSPMKNARKEGVYEIDLFRSTDNGLNLKKEVVTVYVPDGSRGGSNDQGVMHEGCGSFHSIAKLRDGSLLAVLHGRFKSDIVWDPQSVLIKKLHPNRKFKSFKMRCWVMRSIDRGKSWRYLSTVAFDLTEGDRLRIDGFCEPNLLTLPNGNILCFMRTGGADAKHGHYPLYLSQSNDDGKSWSHADPITDRGVWPHACLMKNGVIVLAYGRPSNWLMFSLDQGQTWVGNFCYWNRNNGTTTSYTSVQEVEPDTLLVVYDRLVNDAGGTFNDGTLDWEVVAMRLTVKRKDIRLEKVTGKVSGAARLLA